MEHITSRITAKGQVTVPKKVREKLGIKIGDAISYEVREDSAVIKRVPKVDLEWDTNLEPTLSEWRDDLDDEL
jgi:AbrB family looped-hinge helix DNA binding protein